ncbi:methylenetetrahydrofolate reductase [Spirochaetia bacterium]|nr:methylenetetrahydrofolate reductase [Spirochaetia bacterium]GHV91093.1 methylenetetrahydrofolate reductase [Spirochaetia bacterium]
MKIADVLKQKMTLSFEVFPPKEPVPLTGLLDALDNLYRFKPDFISCTYHAGGDRRDRNMEICRAVRKSGHEIMTHLTCIGNTREDLHSFIGDYIDIGIENILALRGDYPPGWNGTRGDFAHGQELIEFVQDEFPGLCLAAAAYPEKHITAPSLEGDIAHLRIKQEKGAHFFMTQLCHDIRAFERFTDKARKAGIHLPIIAGIMPVLSRDPVIRMTFSNGCSIPAELAVIMGKYEDDKAGFKKAGMEYTVKLIHRFIDMGVNGIHIYTLNRWEDVAVIVQDAGL